MSDFRCGQGRLCTYILKKVLLLFISSLFLDLSGRIINIGACFVFSIIFFLTFEVRNFILVFFFRKYFHHCWSNAFFYQTRIKVHTYMYIDYRLSSTASIGYVVKLPLLSKSVFVYRICLSGFA